MPNELFWESTAEEIRAVLRFEVRRNRAADLRAGLVASVIANVFRRKGTRAFTPADFVETEPKYMSVEQARRELTTWAADVNKQFAQKDSA